MSRSGSGRIVVEIDPDIKRELYVALTKDGLNLKQWFLQNIDTYLSDRSQLRLALAINNKTKTGS